MSREGARGERRLRCTPLSSPPWSNKTFLGDTGEGKLDNVENRLCQTESPSVLMSPSTGRLWDLCTAELEGILPPFYR